MAERTEFLINPSRQEMQRLGRELRACIDEKNDLFVWRSEDQTHFGFAQEKGLGEVQAWLYLNPFRSWVSVSNYSHGGEVTIVEQHVKEHPGLKYFNLDGYRHDPDNSEDVSTIPEKLDALTEEDNKILAELGINVAPDDPLPVAA